MNVCAGWHRTGILSRFTQCFGQPTLNTLTVFSQQLQDKNINPTALTKGLLVAITLFPRCGKISIFSEIPEELKRYRSGYRYHFRVFAAGMEKSWKPCLQTAVGCLLVLQSARTASDVFFYWTMLAGQYARRVESVLSVSFWGALMKDRKYSP